MAKIEIDDEVIRKLAALMSEAGLSEVEVQEGESRLRVSRAEAPVAAAATPVTTHVTVTAPAAGETTDVPHPGTVNSPMVGTVYLSPEPGAAAFVKIGDKVRAGDTLLIIEAMKVMNPIKAATGGTVSRLLIDDGQPVEYGQPLLVVE
jgi:acetyl-CoA carboxylase biotin carboxyl carrier protein